MTTARAAVAAAAVVCALVGSAAACSSTTAGSSAPTVSQVSTLLARHTEAVAAHSPAAFLADVDTAPAAAAFRTRQQTEIAALRSVPLASWSWAVAGAVSDASATHIAAQRYQAPALIVHLTLSYRLARVDPVPSTHDQWWTFVRRGGAVLVAGDDDLAGTGGASWRGPWDYAPVVVRRGTASLVIGHPGQEQTIATIAGAADAAVPAVTSVVGTGWARQVAIFVPATSDEFDELSGGQSTDVAAVTTFDGGTTSGTARIVVRPAALQQLTASGLGVVLRHEITHVATAAVTTPESPRWLIEGLAEYVANLGTGQQVRTAAAELAAAVQQGKLPAALPSDTDFTQGGQPLAQVYEESWLACVFIAQRIGPAGLVAFYRQVGESAAPNDTATAVVLQTTLHEPFATFLAQWRAYLKAELG